MITRLERRGGDYRQSLQWRKGGVGEGREQQERRSGQLKMKRYCGVCWELWQLCKPETSVKQGEVAD